MKVSSTPVVCRFARLRCYAMGCAPPISAQLSIGLLRSGARLLAAGSPRITFRIVHAHSQAQAGTLRRRGQLQLAPRRAEDPFVRCLHLASAANEQSEMVRSPGVGSPSAVLSLSLFNQIVHIVGGPKTSSPWPRSASLRGDSHGGQNIGEAHRGVGPKMFSSHILRCPETVSSVRVEAE